MCHHYKGSRNPPAHLADEFSVRSNHYQLLLPDADFYPLAEVPIVRLDESGEREMVAAQWFRWAVGLGGAGLVVIVLLVWVDVQKHRVIEAR